MRDRRFDHEWHVAINKFNDGKIAGKDWCSWMYSAKSAWQEAPRLKALFEQERAGRLRQTHQQCSHADPVPVENNHLSCCLGVKCAACPHLAAIDAAALTDEQKDEAKAWTCVGHILHEGGDASGEGFILTVDDRMYWDRVYSNLAMSEDEMDDGGEDIGGMPL